MVDTKIQADIEKYLQARHEILKLGQEHPDRIGGNDNVIGRIGEFIALRFLEGLGQRPVKVLSSSNPGYDLIEGDRKTQVKVITEENNRGRTVRLKDPWDQLLVIKLGKHYKPVRIGILTQDQNRRALSENNWSKTPVVSLGMLQPGGLIGKYGCVYQGSEIVV
jgi:hypothetical protein